jgi:hypothetical protein
MLIDSLSTFINIFNFLLIKILKVVLQNILDMRLSPLHI